MKSFNDFQLDPAHECLWHDGTRLPLTRKAFAILNCLVEDAGKVISKDELMEKVWPNVYVGEENLKVYIRELRALLGDSAAHPTYIETYRDRGYCFIAPISDHQLTVSGAVNVPRLYGRAAELATVQQKFHSAGEGTRQIIFVTGEPGIGKTSIVEGFLAQLTGRAKLRVALGQCIESYHEQEPFYPVLEAFGRLLKDPAGAGFAAVLASQAPTWLVQFPAVATGIEAEKLQNAIVGAGRERMLREICDGVEAFTTETPLVLVLEDLHWADRSTLDFLAAIARRRGRARLLIIVTYRPVEVILSNHPLRQLKAELCSHGQATELPLELLTKEAVKEYLSTRFSNSLAETLATEVHEKTDGNPLFVVALMDQLVSHGVVVEHQGTWKIKGGVAQLRSIVPDSLVEIIQKQIDQLTGSEQEILSAASVVGGSFSATVVASVLQMDSLQVEGVCDSLARRHLWLRRAGLEEAPDGQVSGLFQFIHALHRDALYDQCSPGARLSLHRRIGEVIESMWVGQEQEIAAELARHFTESRDNGRVVRYLRMQAENARRRYAYPEALSLLDSAIQLAQKLPPPDNEINYLDSLIQLARIHDQLGNRAKAAELYEAAAERAAISNRREVEVNSLVCLSRELSVGDTCLALEIVDRAVQICDDKINPATRVNAEAWANFLRLAWDGWDTQLADAYRENIEWLRRAGESDLMAHQAFGLAVFQIMTGDYQGGLETSIEIIPALARQGEALGINTHWFRGWSLLLLGRGGEALSVLQDALELVQKNHNEFELAMGRLFLAELYYEAFDPQTAVTLCDQALTTIRETNSKFGLQRALIMAGIAQVGSGNLARAKELLFESSDLYAASKVGLSWYYRMPLHCALSEYWLARGDVAGARQEVERMRVLTDANVSIGWKARTNEVSSQIAIAEREISRAQTEIEDALKIMAERDFPLVAWRVHRTAANVYKEMGFLDKSADHLSKRDSILASFAYSFGSGESLRETVLHGIENLS